MRRLLPQAKAAFEAYHCIASGSASDSQVARSAAGIRGWYRLSQVLEGKVEDQIASLCEGEQVATPEINMAEEWQDVEFEVALDSGSTDNVCGKVDIPGYCIVASPGSKAGQGFIVGNGARVPNDGQSVLSLQTDGCLNTVSSTFQVAAVSRPLMSVGRLADAGLDVVFKKDKADVMNQEGKVVLSFERTNGGLYVAKLRLKRPPNEPFHRPA